MNDKPLNVQGFQLSNGGMSVGKHDFHKVERQGATLPTSIEDFKAPTITGEQTADNIPLTRDLIKEIAMDIGKEVVDYVERMYPQAIEATTSTFKLSLRNCIHNEIMAAIQVNDEGKIIERLEYRKKFRRHLKKLRKAENMDELLETIKESPKNPAETW
jgi:hypothetical protein